MRNAYIFSSGIHLTKQFHTDVLFIFAALLSSLDLFLSVCDIACYTVVLLCFISLPDSDCESPNNKNDEICIFGESQSQFGSDKMYWELCDRSNNIARVRLFFFYYQK